MNNEERMSNPVKPYLGVMPVIEEDVFIADTAAVIGNVKIGSESSVWYNCCLLYTSDAADE